ncbi:MAG TPA: histidine phosphatase family protein [Alphaproteobacteria bacterium]|nr:histidine phosphatase family protein [Alphaproteobacteria bacterium]
MSLPKRPFIFVRHGQTDWNVEGRVQGHTDVPLNAEGVRQAASICQTLLENHVDYVISSPLTRALKTAAYIAETHQKPIHIDSRLKERTFGSYEGQRTDELLAKHGLSAGSSLNQILPPDAEAWPETTARALAAIGDWMTRHPKSKLVFVSHGAVYRALVEALTGNKVYADNAKPYLFTPTAAGWDITAL